MADEAPIKYPQIAVDDDNIIAPLAINTISVKDMDALSRGDLFELLAAKAFLQVAANSLHQCAPDDLPQYVLIEITR